MSKITDYAAHTGAALAAGDLFPVVDVSDTSMAATGTDKKLSWDELKAGFMSAGSWTPALKFGGNSVGLTYTTQVGRYVRIGNVVHAWMFIVINNKGSSTGDATVQGLPFTTRNSSGQIMAATVGLVGGTSNVVTAWADPNGTVMALYRQSASANLTDAQIVNGAQVMITIVYECEP